MKTFKIIITTLLILHKLQTCGKGCLSCSNNKCKYCNNLRQYSSNSEKTKCIHNNIPNCQIFKDNICIECSEGYYNKLTTTNEIECSQGLVIDNCQKMKGSSLCDRCKKGYKITDDGNKCIILKNIISNCLKHYEKNNDVLCELCVNNYLLSEDQKTCDIYKTDSNCLISSNFYCGECQTGYEIKSNLLNSFEDFELNGSFINDILSVNEEPYRQTSLIKCKNTIDHCLLYDEIKLEEEEENEKNKLITICKRCENGFFVHYENKIKTICNESTEIENCDVYSENEVCEFCKSGFYLENNHCLKVENKNLIQYCLYYENGTECKQCLNQFKLVDEEIHEELKLKMNLINKAIDSSKEDIKKVEDKENYEKNLDNKLEKIISPNIIDFIHLHTQQENTVRELLEKDYLKKSVKIHLKTLNTLKVPQCVLNTIANCLEFLNGDCIKCEKNFYLIDLQCRKLDEIDIIPNCVDYSPEKICKKCKNGYINYNNLCFRMNPIHNCKKKVFNKNGKCLLCKKGYYYDVLNSKCVEFTNMINDNCLIFSDIISKNCLMCDPEYFMNSKEKCEYEQEIPDVKTRVLNVNKDFKLI